MTECRKMNRILRMRMQPQRWKNQQFRCEIERGMYYITQLGGGDFYSGLMHLDLIHAQIRAELIKLMED